MSLFASGKYFYNYFDKELLNRSQLSDNPKDENNVHADFQQLFGSLPH